jgi:hypothetical protein
MQQQMKSFHPEQDPHKGGCGLCHNPHTQTTIAGAYQSCATSNCHARSDTLTAMHRGLTGQHKLETCGACHVAHTWKAGKTDCKSCHSGITDPAVQLRRPPRGAVESDSVPGSQGAWPAPPRDDGTGVHVSAPRAPIPAGSHLLPASWSGTRQAATAFAPRTAGRERWRRAGQP